MDQRSAIETRIESVHDSMTYVSFALIMLIIITGFVFKFFYAFMILRYILTAGTGLIGLYLYELNELKNRLVSRLMRFNIYMQIR